MKSTSGVVLALLLLVAASVEGAWGLSLGASAGSLIGLRKSAYFPLKAQGGWGAGLDLTLPIFAPVYLGLSLGYHQFLPSGASGGFTYRGYGGADIRLLIEAGGPLARFPNGLEVLAGSALGGSAHFDRYSLTELYFFYPGLSLEPYVELRFPKLPRSRFGLTLPIALDYRRDLALSLSFGLLARWRFSP